MTLQFLYHNFFTSFYKINLLRIITIGIRLLVLIQQIQKIIIGNNKQ